MLKYVFLFIAVTGIGIMPTAVLGAEAPEATTELSSKYISIPAGYLMVLRKGDDVMAYLKQLAIEKRIESASISGLGFVNVTFGYWDAAQKTYQPKSFNSMELASLTGSIAWEKNQPSIHAHGVAADKEFNTHGGHILELQVDNGSVEITVIVHPQRLERAKDKTIDANVLVL